MIQLLLDLTTNPPGNFLYHLAIAVSILAALQVSLRFYNESHSLQLQRVIRTLQGLLILRLVLFALGYLAYSGFFDSRLILPLLDRAAAALSIAWVVWAWAQTKARRPLNIFLIGAHVTAALLLAVGIPGWLQASGLSSFSDTWYRLWWELFSLSIVLSGSAMVITMRPAAWQSCIIFLCLHFAASMADLFLVHVPVDYSAPLILAQAAAYPFLLSLPQWKAPAASTPALVSAHPITRERRRYATDQKTFQAALHLAVDTRPDQVCTSITSFTAHMMVSDLVFLMSVPDSAGDMAIEGGYDLIQEESWPGASIHISRIPEISRALQDDRPVRLLLDGANSQDIQSLSAVLGIRETGNLMFVPLVHPVSGPLGGLVMLSSYSRRIWSKGDEEYLAAGAAALVQVLVQRRRPLHTATAVLEAGSLSHTPAFDPMVDMEPSTPETVMLPREADLQLAAPVGILPSGQSKEDLVAAKQQIQELEAALYAARQRLEKYENINVTPMDGSRISLASILESALLQAGSQAEDKHVTMRMDIPTSLPPIQVDPESIRSALVITLQKAMQHMAASGTLVIRATTGSSPSGSTHIHLKVISTGSSPVKSFTASETVQPGVFPEDVLLDKARTLVASQSGRLWVESLVSGAVITHMLIPAETGS